MYCVNSFEYLTLTTPSEPWESATELAGGVPRSFFASPRGSSFFMLQLASKALLRDLSIKQLRNILAARGGAPCTTCKEKDDLVAAVMAVLDD